MKCKQIIECFQQRTPESFAMEWDNVGLLVGRKEKEVNRILIALDATNEVVKEAIKQKVDLLVTHHPILFSSVQSVTDQDFLGNKLLLLIEHNIACFAMHTNYDICQMADLAASKFGITDTEPLEVTYEQDGEKKGVGTVSVLEEPITLKECAQKVKKAFELEHVLLFGDETQLVQRIALSPGSGRHMLEEAKKAEAQVLITGDIGHHEGLDAMDMGISIIEAGHYGLEKIFIQDVADYLSDTCKDCKILVMEQGSPYSVD